MPESTVRLAHAAAAGDELVLSPEEAAHIRHCRALKQEAKAMVFDLASLYTCTLPSARVALCLVGAAD